MAYAADRPISEFRDFSLIDLCEVLAGATPGPVADKVRDEIHRRKRAIAKAEDTGR